jgi:hypothetical protein
MTGKGGTILYREGVLVFGRENFIIETILIGELEEIRLIESRYNKTNLWPIGYNGNTSHAIVLTEEQQVKISTTKKEKFKNVPESQYFYEACYCILTPQSKAKNADLVVQKLINDDFLNNDFDPEGILFDKM